MHESIPELMNIQTLNFHKHFFFYVSVIFIFNASCIFCETRLEAVQQDKADRFLQWLKLRGFLDVVPPKDTISVHISLENELGQGLIANSNFAKDKVLITIPFSLAIELKPEDPRPYVDASWMPSLAAKLLREISRGDNSFWKPYFDLFPQRHPIPWLDLDYHDFVDIQYEPTIRRITDLQREAIQQFKQSNSSVLAESPWHLFGWAITMVWTNAFSILAPVQSGDSTKEWRHMFLPVADLVNHDHEPNVYWKERQEHWDGLEIIASQYISKGTPLLAKFDDITTEDMFLFYGLVTEKNPRDSTILFYNIEEVVEWFISRYHPEFKDGEKDLSEGEFETLMEQARKGVVRQLRRVGRAASPLDFEPQDFDPHDNTHGNAIAIYNGASVDHRLLGALAQMTRFVEDEDKNQSEESWILDEEIAYKMISFRCIEVLKSFPTTLALDLQILEHMAEDNTVEPSLSLAVKFRIVKKKMLYEFIDAHPDFETPVNKEHLIEDSFLHDEL